MSHPTRAGWTGAVRRVLPPPVYLLIVGLLLVPIEITWFAVWHFEGPVDALETLLEIRDGLIVCLLIAYGVFRVTAFHPLFLRDYSTWLERTPWRPGLPLPLGPVHLAWPDLIVAGGLAFLLNDPRDLLVPIGARTTSLSGFLMFVISHAMTVAVAVWLSRPRGSAYATAFLIALGARLSLWSPLAGIVAITSGVVVAHTGLSRSWNQFPWVETSDWLSRMKTGWKSIQAQSGQGFADDPAPDRAPPAQLGWPFGVCSPYVVPRMISTQEKLLLSALFGFWIHTLLAPLALEKAKVVSGGILGYGAMILAIVILSKFGGNHYPSINLVGRLLTFRWVVPGYDAVVIGPLSVLVVPAVTGCLGHFWLAVPFTILTPLVVTLMLWSACLIGPSPANWKLTAPARLVPGRLNRNQFEELS